MSTTAQSDSSSAVKSLKHPRIHIGIFAPLYLDSAFDEFNVFRYADQFPRFAVPGFEFVEGCKMAVSALAKEGIIPEITVVDTRSWFFKNEMDAKTGVHTTINEGDSMQAINRSYDETGIANLKQRIDSMQVIICMEKDNEFMRLAKFAQKKNAVFLSAVYPNHGGILQYPKFFMFNSSIKTHVEFMLSEAIKKNNAQLLVVSRKDKQDERIVSYIKAKKNSNIKFLNLDTSFILSQHLDSTKKNIIIGASFNEAFAFTLSDSLNKVKNKKYELSFWGMPNWDGFRAASTNGQKMYPFLYTAAYYNEKKDSICTQINNNYLSKYMGNPGDYVYKGYEIMMLASRLNPLAESQEIALQMNENDTKLFSQLQFEETKINDKSSTPDFYENKHLFILKKTGKNIQKWQEPAAKK